jgi:hypothetical protein
MNLPDQPVTTEAGQTTTTMTTTRSMSTILAQMVAVYLKIRRNFDPPPSEQKGRGFNSRRDRDNGVAATEAQASLCIVCVDISSSDILC